MIRHPRLDRRPDEREQHGFDALALGAALQARRRVEEGGHGRRAEREKNPARREVRAAAPTGRPRDEVDWADAKTHFRLVNWSKKRVAFIWVNKKVEGPIVEARAKAKKKKAKKMDPKVKDVLRDKKKDKDKDKKKKKK